MRAFTRFKNKHYKYSTNHLLSYPLALLKAIADKLIPDIPEETRIACLQQTDAKEVGSSGNQQLGANAPNRTVLEEVIERATARDSIQQEISGKWKINEIQKVVLHRVCIIINL